MKIGLVTGLLTLVGSLGAAQETTGDIHGRLRSSSGAPIAGATVTATSADLLGTRRARSASDGVFQFVALPPGSYTIRVTAIGHRPAVIDSVRVQLGRTGGLPETLLEATAVQLGEVRIAAPSLTLDPARTTIGATLEASDFAALPADRDYKSLMAILPHANTSYHGDPVNVGGATGLENMYFIDGINVTAPFQASSGTSLPYNFVRAVEVRAGGYEAQYGRALGAIVNAITHTGTNVFESSIFGFFTHDGLSAEPRAQPTLRETGAYSYDVGCASVVPCFATGCGIPRPTIPASRTPSVRSTPSVCFPTNRGRTSSPVSSPGRRDPRPRWSCLFSVIRPCVTRWRHPRTPPT
jgi:hypothetical protein